MDRSSFSVHRSAFVLLSLAFLLTTVACRFRPGIHSGESVVEIGRQGAGPGRFNFPRTILVAPNNDLYVIDRTGRIQHLDPAGECVAVWNVPECANGTPTGAALDRDGSLLVADTHYSRILRFVNDGTSYTTFGKYGQRPGEMVYPQDVAVDGDGNIYVANYGGRDRIIRFRSDGTFIKEWGESGEGPGQFHRPMALAVRDEREIVVADSCNHRVQRFDLNGQYLGSLGGVGRGRGELTYPYDVAVGPDGSIFVCEYGNNRVTRFARNGKATVLGTHGNMLGCLRGPWGVAVGRDGAVYVADTYNHRLQRFAPGTM